MGYLRDKSRPQGDRPIHQKQANFGGGLNVDDPATDIDVNEVIGSENYIWFEKYGRGRSGSVEVASLPGSGTVNAHYYHQGIKSLILHRGTKLYRWNGATATELLNYGNTDLGIDAKSIIKPYGKNALLFTPEGIFFLLVEETVYARLFQFNFGQPEANIGDSDPINVSPYKYKYAYTFSTIIDIPTGDLSVTGDRLSVDNKLIHESPPTLLMSYYSIRSLADPISASNPYTVNNLSADPNFLETYSHFSIYRTLDLGKNGLNNLNVDQYAWVGDVDINSSSFIDTIKDNTEIINDNNETLEGRLLQPDFQLQNIGWTTLPNGDVGEVTNTFVFSAVRDAKDLYYSQRINDNICGFYNAGFQTEKFDDGIQILAGTPDLLSVICNRRTYIGSLTSFNNVGLLEAVISLNHFTLADSQVGVRDYGSFSEVDTGTYIAICSDASVRIWDGASWSRDFSVDKINTIISQVDETITTGVYYDGSYYIWFDTTDSGSPTLCYRLSLKKYSGRGWTQYTGEDWIFPAANRGAFVADNFLLANGLGVDFLFAIDITEGVNGKIYWIETFDGRENVSINGFDIREYFADKVSSSEPAGFNILCRARVKEMTGELEAWNLIHQESHAYMRDLTDSALNLLPPPITYPTLKVDARAYKDGVIVSVNTAGEVNPGDDIHFDYRVEGSRIAVEFESNRSGHELIGIDTRFRVQDILRPGRSQSVTVSSTFQKDFQQDLNVWLFTRPYPTATLNRASGQQFTRNGATFVPAPDLRNQGVGITVADGAVSPYTVINTTVFNAFTYHAWIKTPTLANGAELILAKFNGATTITFLLNDTDTITLPQGSGSVVIEDPTTAIGNVNGWSEIFFVREAGSSTFNVYQNDSLKGTLTFAGTFGGTSIEIGGVV